MNFIVTNVDRDMKILGYLVLFLFITISGTIMIYHNVIEITLVAMGISIIVAGFAVVIVMSVNEKRKEKQ
jgi:hypothetical protein